MNKLKANILWNALLFLLPVGLIILGVVTNNEPVLGLGILMGAIMLIKLIRLILCWIKPKTREKYLNRVNDERVNYIAGKSAIVSYIFMEFSSLAILIYAIAMELSTLQTILSGIMCIGLIAYMITYFILSKKE